jgi:hypothetical protein
VRPLGRRSSIPDRALASLIVRKQGDLEAAGKWNKVRQVFTCVAAVAAIVAIALSGGTALGFLAIGAAALVLLDQSHIVETAMRAGGAKERTIDTVRGLIYALAMAAVVTATFGGAMTYFAAGAGIEALGIALGGVSIGGGMHWGKQRVDEPSRLYERAMRGNQQAIDKVRAWVAAHPEDLATLQRLERDHAERDNYIRFLAEEIRHGRNLDGMGISQGDRDRATRLAELITRGE